MGRPYSDDLRERVVRAVIKGGLLRHQAVAQFGVGISTAINWVQRFHETGGVKPDQIGGYRPKGDRCLNEKLELCMPVDFCNCALIVEIVYLRIWTNDARLPSHRILFPVGLSYPALSAYFAGSFVDHSTDLESFS
jgi:putative transposase